MKLRKVMLVSVLAVLISVSTAFAGQRKKGTPTPPKANDVPAELALTGIPMDITPGQLPDQFSTQLRNDVNKSRGVAILRQKGNNIEYTFAYWGLTSSLTQVHFHYGPHDQVGSRAFSVCGVAGESPECPTGTRNSITGTWANADVRAVKAGDIVIAFHTEKYPPPGGEIAVYVPASKKSAKIHASHSHGSAIATRR